MYYGDNGYEEDCAPDFRFESDRNNPNYAYQYAKYCEELIKEESKGNVFERSINIEYTMPIEISYMNVMRQTDKAILINIDNVYKAWIPKSQIVAIGNDCMYITKYFSKVYKKEKIEDLNEKDIRINKWDKD